MLHPETNTTTPCRQTSAQQRTFGPGRTIISTASQRDVDPGLPYLRVNVGEDQLSALVPPHNPPFACRVRQRRDCLGVCIGCTVDTKETSASEREQCTRCRSARLSNTHTHVVASVGKLGVQICQQRSTFKLCAARDGRRLLSPTFVQTSIM